ncbi:hypothetical protein S40285_09331 [Stachybotrys chlorohalonatus IBT 40285]|uniref:Arylsulfatase n=1 Tax=Stachybotrys chlorohalonatus (strain IBT 40285) TaxID=1283841 RepID=A0A084Q805_STAC4|nr:hypothetical protein S40285_09331 [Stachybotrys chlorohalonata IBT 40285]
MLSAPLVSLGLALQHCGVALCEQDQGPWETETLLQQTVFDIKLSQGATEQHHVGHGALDNEAIGRRKNIILIISDDQDATMNSSLYMPRLQEHIVKRGTTFANHFTTTAICCPSRVSLWTGRQPHNTNVTDVDPPYGGFPKFISQGLNDAYLPVWLQAAGYATFYTGKMFNSHTIDNYDSPHLAGWTSSNFLLDPGTYSYLNPICQKDHERPVHHQGRHTTDLIQEHAASLINEAIDSGQPFFVAIAPIAPHSNIDSNNGGTPRMTDPIPLERHKQLFSDLQIPRTDNFNPESPSGVSWVATLPRLSNATVDYLDEFYHQRLRTLQGVDELIEQVVLQLEDAGVLQNTYVIFTSDNGFHLGQHRLPAGKECGFEEDIRVPLYIRGPGVSHGYLEEAITAHIDLAPTIFDIAGIELRKDFDGLAIPLHWRTNSTKEERPHRSIREHVAVEFWGVALAEGETGGFDGEGAYVIPNNTYKAIRLKSDAHDLYYAVWCNNDHELYDIKDDPYQRNNIYPSAAKPSSAQETFLGSTLALVIARLDSLLMVMKSCKGATCRMPWQALHPDGDVTTLQEALQPKFDEFYQSQQQVAFAKCEPGYIISSEGPQMGYQYRRGLTWSHWT